MFHRAARWGKLVLNCPPPPAGFIEGLPVTTELRPHAARHAAATGRSPLAPPPVDLVRVGSRRWFLQTGLAGLAGLSLPDALRLRATGTGPAAGPRAVILF